ncbi:lipid-A-disaccharide synthase [Polynucleobacter sp. IMCC 30228]|nr:lipid-A-disaccharide synthase [Polynucleobacter sp. IMCC 30228]
MILLPPQRAALFVRLTLPTLACVAGEPSGDLLAASSLQALKQIPAQAGLEMYGIGGPFMQAQGLQSLWPMEVLSVRGYVEALRQLPTILRVRKALITDLLGAKRPDVFLGIDAPDFNLGVEEKLRSAGIPTVHFISPSIWAWRGSRIKKIQRAVDHMLCIFPFEKAIYEAAGIQATYVGHPLASSIPLEPNVSEARARLLELDPSLQNLTTAKVVAVLPGSRHSEIQLIAPIFFATMPVLAEQLEEAVPIFVIPVAAPHLRPALEQLRLEVLTRHPQLQIHLFDGQADLILEAADVVLIASGTATLQAALWKKPMVISYRVPWLTAQVMKRQAYLPYVGLPNILCGEFVVPELLQSQAQPQKLAKALLNWLLNPDQVAALRQRFSVLHHELRQPTALLVAQVLAEKLSQR